MIEGEIRALEAERCQALVRRDIAALERLLDDNLVHVHASGAIDDKAKYLRGVESNYTFHDVRRGDIEIKVYSDVVVTHGRMELTASRRGDEQRHTVQTVTTQVWIRTAPGWKQSVCHSTFAGEFASQP